MDEANPSLEKIVFKIFISYGVCFECLLGHITGIFADSGSMRDPLRITHVSYPPAEYSGTFCSFLLPLDLDDFV